MARDHNALGALFLKAISEVLHQAVEPNRVLALILDQAVTLTSADRGAFVEVGQGGAFTYRVLHRFARRHASGAAGAYSRSLFAHALAALKAGRDLLEERNRLRAKVRSDSPRGRGEPDPPRR